MKYIKTYESIGDYKKYFVIEVGPNARETETKYLIYQIIDQKDKMNIEVVSIFIWKDNEFKRPNTYSEIYIGPNQMKTAIYETDTLEDAKDYISTITDAKKYNL